jgi:hypothetical protein
VGTPGTVGLLRVDDHGVTGIQCLVGHEASIPCRRD